MMYRDQHFYCNDRETSKLLVTVHSGANENKTKRIHVVRRTSKLGYRNAANLLLGCRVQKLVKRPRHRASSFVRLGGPRPRRGT